MPSQGIDLLGGLLRVFPERPPPPSDARAIRRVLVVKLSSIGDVVHALPVASALKRANPSVHVAWAIDDWASPLVLGHRAIDRAIVLPSLIRWPRSPARFAASLAPAVRELRRDRYDVVLDLQGLARSALVSRLARADLRLARAGQREGAHLVSYGVPLPPPPLHAVDEYLAVARRAGAAIDGPPVFDVPVQDAARVRVTQMLRDAGADPDAPLIVVGPSASRRWKNWPADRWAAVIQALSPGATVAIAGTAAQRARHRDIAARAGGRAIDLTGRTSLADLVALVARASLHVAHDSGSAHVAAALGVPVVAIYGPTNPDRLAPYGQASHTISHRASCGRTCPAFCVRGRRCLLAVTPDEVVALARQARTG